MGIKENLKKITEQIDNTKVKIIAVTKYAKQEQIFEAYNLGIRNFGESYLQDALEKISKKYDSEKSNDLINWHFIGRLQKNKVKHVVGKFCLIHSIDSLDLAELINKTAYEKKLIQDVLIQVNISKEASKSGFAKEDLKSVFEKLVVLENIKILGLMTIGQMIEDKSAIRKCFIDLKNLKEELNKNYMTNLKELSMGMSNDYVTAVECGSTMVRIGRALFN